MPFFGQYIAKRPYTNIIGNNTSNDNSVNNHTITNTGSVGFRTGVNGESNRAFDFTGAGNKYLSLVSSVLNNIAGYMNNQGTIMFHIYHDASSTTRGFISGFSTDSQASILIQSNSSPKSIGQYSYDGSSTPRHLSDNNWTFSNSVWYHYVATFDSLNLETFKDGNSVYSFTFTGNAKVDSTNVLLIGTRDDYKASGSLDGALCNIRAYGVKLSKGQIKIITAQKGRIRI